MLTTIDFHIHPCEKVNWIEEFLRIYVERGYTCVALTDHYALARFAEEREVVKRFLAQTGSELTVYVSAEVNYLTDRPALQSDVDPRSVQDLDFISAGPHHYTRAEIDELGDALTDHATAALLEVAEREDVRVILHPFIHVRNDMCPGALPRSYLNTFAERAKSGNKTVEIHRDMDARWLPMIEALMAHEVYLVVGSDAHTPEEITDSRAAVELIRQVNPDYRFIGLAP